MKIIFYLAFIFFTTTCIYGATFTSAIAEITPVGNNTVKGSVIFLQRGSDVEVTVALYNVNTNPDGYHGIHVHVWGDLRGLLTNFGKIGANVTGALSVGTHFDPYNTKLHGCPDLTTGENQGSHGGDLGNWLAVGGTIEGVKTFSNFTLDGPINSIVGRAVVIHANEDDCADINSSGSRLGVGVIGIRWVDSTKDKNTARAGTGFDKAVCVLEGTSECTGSYCDITNTGFAYFSQVGKNSIRITAQVFGLTSERGWHIHTYGDLSSPNGDSTGGHWNPLNHKHGLPGQSELHLGDLGSIKTFSKNPDFGIYDNTIRHTATEWKIENLIGRAIIIHSDVDHGGDESVCSGSSVSGNSGKRVYQCVIGIVNPVSQKESITKLPTICTSEFKFDNTWESIPCASS